MKLRLFALVTVLSLAGLVPGSAGATGWWHLSPSCDADSVGSGSLTVSDSVTGAFWTFQVDYEVFSPDNCSNPKPVKGSFTYVYTVTLADQGIIPVSLQNMRVLIASSAYVVSAGYLTGGPGVAPTAVTVETTPANSVTASFADGSLAIGDTSLPIYIVSPYQPGAGTVNLQATVFTGAGVGALVPTALPQACPCTTSYWVLRTTGWIFFLGDFPGGQLDAIKQRAVDISGGFFTSKSDLINALLYPGLLDVKKKAKKELAALLMNVAAGELYPANTKCRLFLGTDLDEDGDGVSDGTVAGAIGEIITKIQSNDFWQQLDALSQAAQINSGQDVLGMTLFH